MKPTYIVIVIVIVIVNKFHRDASLTKTSAHDWQETEVSKWMNEWMNEYDLSDTITETVAGALK